MSDKINDGGPAFPYEERDGDGLPVRDYFGMSLRDYMATHFAAALVAHRGLLLGSEETAKSAYRLTDGMLAARERTTP